MVLETRNVLSGRVESVLLLVLVSLGSLMAGAQESQPAYPLWDGSESVADYPPTKTLDLGNGVKLELVLIPAGY